jgi:hypothetical protein
MDEIDCHYGDSYRRASGMAETSQTPRAQMRSVVDTVGVFGALALMHECFSGNPARYETYPVIQVQLAGFSRRLYERLKEIDDPTDWRISAEHDAVAFESHGITPLHQPTETT